MKPLKELCSYWATVFHRAWTDSLRLCGANPRAMIFVVIATPIAAGAYAYFAGPEKAWDKILWFGLSTLALWLVIVLPLFVVRLAATPHLLEIERAEGNSQIVTALEAEKKSLAAEVDRARNADPATNFKRAQLGKFITRFDTLIASLESSNPSAYEEFFNIDNEAHNYIVRNFDGFNEYMRKYAVQNSHIHKPRPDPSDYDYLVTVSKYRQSALRELLEMLG